MAESEATNFFTPKLYDRLKFIAQILLPALGTLYFAIGSGWNLPHTTEIVGTITAIDLFLGTVLQLSSSQYYKSGANFDGVLAVEPGEDGGDKAKFVLDKDPLEVVDDPGKHSYEFQVKRRTDK